jgi:hypothetical protein
MNDLPDKSKVLLAIMEIKGYLTQKEVRQRAKKLTNASDNIVYSGPQPNFNDDETFESAWEDLLRGGYLVKSISDEYECARFVANTNESATKTVCHGHNEEKSINSIVR